jgi:N-methylhydantoinase A/oxoprolinase/acetone carboxylase beta subunit
VHAPGTVCAATDVGGTFTDLVYFFADPVTLDVVELRR